MKILPNTLILSPLFCYSKKRLLEEIVECAYHETGVDSDSILEAINEREKLGSTIFFQGISLPHAVIYGSSETCGILSILDSPVSFNSVDADEQSIDIAYTLLISPGDDYAVTEEFLQKLTAVLSNNDLLNALRLARNEKSKIRKILEQIDDKLVQYDTSEEGGKADDE